MSHTTTANDARLCIVITCYRQSGLLPEAVCSALLQEPKCKLILVNDGCPYADSHLFCMAVRAAYPDRILYLRQTNRGPASARNAGIELALRAWPCLEALFLLDGDNRLGGMTIRRMHMAMTESGADWIFSDLEIIGNRGIMGMAGAYSVLEHVLGNYVDTGSLIARRVLDDGVRFDPTFIPGFEDWDFWLRAANHGFRGEYAPASGFLYRSRPESLVHDAGVHRTEVVGHLRRRHDSLINPRNWVRMEHQEAPRYALLLDTNRIALFTDPSERSESMERDTFLHRLAWLAAAGEFARIPSYLIVLSADCLTRLDNGKLLHGLLWRLEAVASRCQSPIALACTRGTNHDRVDHLDKRNAPIVVCRTDVAICSRGEPSPSFVHLPELLAATDTNSAIDDFILAVRQIRALVKSQMCLDAFQINSRNRRKLPITHGIQSLFDANPLYPLANARFRVGFLVRGEISGPALDHLSFLISAAKAAGASAHLFWISSESIPAVPSEPMFDTITFLSADQIGRLGSESTRCEVLGALCMMDVAVNHECPEWLVLSGALKRLGTNIVFSACRSSDVVWTRAVLDAGLRFEHSVSAYVVNCSFLRSRWSSLGIPGAKLPMSFGDWLTQAGDNESLRTQS